MQQSGSILLSDVDCVGDTDPYRLAEFLLALDSNPEYGRHWCEVVWVGEWSHCGYRILYLHLISISHGLGWDREGYAVELVLVGTPCRHALENLRLGNKVDVLREVAGREV